VTAPTGLLLVFLLVPLLVLLLLLFLLAMLRLSWPVVVVAVLRGPVPLFIAAPRVIYNCGNGPFLVSR